MPTVMKPGTVAEDLREALADGGVETIATLSERTGHDHTRLSDAATLLEVRGLLTREAVGKWCLTEDGLASLEEPLELRPERPATLRSAPADTLRQRAWSAMRMARVFSVGSILMIADRECSDSRSNLASYFRALKAAGYILELDKRQPGFKRGSNGFKKFCLVKNTGPIAPAYNRHRATLRDANTGETASCKA